jgi:protocatechuate 4,5-dioxygenase beta chain
MAKIVSAVASTHNPRIFWNRDQADKEDYDRLYGSFAQVRQLLAASRPDVIVILANDHMDGFFFDNMPTFSVMTGARAAGPYWYETEIMHLPSYDAAVAQDAARQLLRNGREEGIYFSELQQFKIDHAFTLPLSFIRPEADIPIVPIVTNTFGYPLAPQNQWLAMGKFLQQEIAQWPRETRVAVVASFNLTVEVGGPKAGKTSPEFNRWLVEQMSRGNADEMVRSLTVPRLIQEGNSTAEFLNYISLLGILGDRVPDFIQHKPVKGVGMCPVAFWKLD